jgi:hypothetical protein
MAMQTHTSYPSGRVNPMPMKGAHHDFVTR